MGSSGRAGPLETNESLIGEVVQDENGASMNAQAAGRLDSFRRLLVHLRERLSLNLGFVLWDGSTVPADLPPDELAIVFADEGVIASLIRQPNLHTILNLLVTARVDIRGGWISDLVSRRSSLRTREIIRHLDKRLVIGTALKFLFTPRGGPWPLEAG